MLLNERTDTVHKPSGTQGRNLAVCGSLRYVPEGQIRQIDRDPSEAGETTQYCGRCFENGGGY